MKLLRQMKDAWIHVKTEKEWQMESRRVKNKARNVK